MRNVDNGGGKGGGGLISEGRGYITRADGRLLVFLTLHKGIFNIEEWGWGGGGGGVTGILRY